MNENFDKSKLPSAKCFALFSFLFSIYGTVYMDMNAFIMLAHMVYLWIGLVPIRGFLIKRICTWAEEYLVFSFFSFTFTVAYV